MQSVCKLHYSRYAEHRKPKTAFTVKFHVIVFGDRKAIDLKWLRCFTRLYLGDCYFVDSVGGSQKILTPDHCFTATFDKLITRRCKLQPPFRCHCVLVLSCNYCCCMWPLRIQKMIFQLTLPRFTLSRSIIP